MVLNKYKIILSILVIVFLFSVLLIAFTSSSGESKTFDSTKGDYGKIDIKSSTGTQLASYELIFSSEQCLVDCSAEFNITLFTSGQLFQNVQFKTFDNVLKSEVNKNKYKLFVKETESFTEYEPVFAENCNDVISPINGTKTKVCVGYIDKYKETIKLREVWKPYNNETKSPGNYQLRIEAKKTPSESVDFIPVAFGVELNEYAWWNGAWSKKMDINVTGGTSALDNFTVFMNVTYDSDMQTDFDDLRFVNGSCSTSNPEQLFYEIDSKVNSANAYTWVKIPLLVPGNNTICMYYGNPSATNGENTTDTWDKYYYGVFHLTNTSGFDSKMKNSVTSVTGTLAIIDGTFGKALNFTGSQYLVGTNFNFSRDIGLTVEVMQMRTTSTSYAPFVSKYGSTKNFYFAREGSGAGLYTEYGGVNYGTASDRANFTKGYLTFMVNSSGNGTFFNDDDMFASTIYGTVSYTANSFRIGQDEGGGAYTTGEIDEVRFSLTNRSVAWINRSYRNTDYKTIVFGSEQSLSYPLITILYPENRNYSYNVSDLNYTSTGIDCWYSINGGNTNSTSQVCNLNFTNVTSTEGSNTWTIYANNSEGMVNSTSITFFKDTVYPLVNITFPTKGNYSVSITTFNFSITETNKGSCWYNIGAGNITTSCSNNVTGISLTTQGSNTWFVYANDTSGNLNSSSVTFMFDNSPPNLTFLSQAPIDLTSLNTINNPLNITYNITDQYSEVNLSTIKIYHKSNYTFRDYYIITNGTANTGYDSGPYTSNVSSQFLFRVNDNEIYPSVNNLNVSVFYTTYHDENILNNANSFVAVELINVSNQTEYNFYEIMSNSTGIQRAYYCNDSYTFTKSPSISPNCVNYYNLPANQAYNHIHNDNSSHQMFPFLINTTLGQIGSVKVTSKSYFLIRGNNPASQVLNYYSVNNTVRLGATKVTTNDGTSWTNQTFTVDAHIHQYTSTTTFYYYVCANDTLGNGICSSLRSDMMDLGGLAPYPATIITPVRYGNYSSQIIINYTEAESPNNYSISKYNITLVYENNTEVGIITSDNGLNLNYTYDSSAIANGLYRVAVTAYDSNNLSSTAYSGPFNIDNLKPNCTLIIPLNGTISQNRSYNFTMNSSDDRGMKNATVHLWKNNANYNSTSVNIGSNDTGIVISNIADGDYVWWYSVYDISGNEFITSNNSLTVDNIAPSVNILFPENNTWYNYTFSSANYTVTHYSGNISSCWFNINDTNVTLVCIINITNNITNMSLISGTNNLTVWSNDSVNNVGIDQHRFYIDTVIPLIDWSSDVTANEGSSSDGVIYFNATFTETNCNYLRFKYRLVGDSSWTTQENSCSPSTFTTSTLTNNKYEYYIQIEDKAKNTNQTASRNITLSGVSSSTSGSSDGGNYGQWVVQSANISIAKLYSLVVDYSDKWEYNNNNVITLLTKDIDNKLIDVDNINLTEINGKSFIFNTIKKSTGTYDIIFVVTDQTIKNLNFRLSVTQASKTMTREINYGNTNYISAVTGRAVDLAQSSFDWSMKNKYFVLAFFGVIGVMILLGVVIHDFKKGRSHRQQQIPLVG